MSVSKTLSPEARRTKIGETVAKLYAKGTSLPEIRKALAKALGGTASLYLGTADPVYYRLVGLDSPLVDGKGKRLPATASASVLRSAVRRRRDLGVRWDVLAASIEATIGRRVSNPEAKALYAKAGGDLEASYAGRGTRVAAPATYADPALAPEAVGSATK